MIQSDNENERFMAWVHTKRKTDLLLRLRKNKIIRAKIRREMRKKGTKSNNNK